MEYIFFIEDLKIFKISFSKFIELAECYKKQVSLQTKLRDKRKIAGLIMRNYCAGPRRANVIRGQDRGQMARMSWTKGVRI
jgi:hypothetical protein